VAERGRVKGNGERRQSPGSGSVGGGRGDIIL
jgi:hypothetical protein